MILVVVAVSVCVIALGAYGLAVPAGLVSFIKHWRSGTALLVAVALRLVFGVALWLVAPFIARAFGTAVAGTVSILAGMVLPSWAALDLKRS